jgi:hypothetical protein
MILNRGDGAGERSRVAGADARRHG